MFVSGSGHYNGTTYNLKLAYNLDRSPSTPPSDDARNSDVGGAVRRSTLFLTCTPAIPFTHKKRHRKIPYYCSS